ncbi:sigma-70 family RNA polymerase sigma factor [Mycobacterium sp. OAE908]|uniref:sigma-70 family RNA polymerase sigma factor n=1 Tax=Mycobacterium sp. OAE908 TaxID=2817899 RepID=UPI001AE9A83F
MPAQMQDTERFCRHVIPLGDQILAAATTLTRTRQDAEDLAQEVMLRAYAGFHTFRDGTNARAWLYRILHNTWVSQYRKTRCRPDEFAVGDIADLHSAATLRTYAARSAEESALESMTDGDLRAALAALQESVRTTVFYADVLQFSCKEIAAISDCPVGTVSSRLARGRKQLRNSLISQPISRVSAA